MNVVVIGTGSIGMQYANLLVKLGIKPVLVSIRENRRKELAAAGWSVTGSLAESNADFCIIATETKRHVSDALESSKLGMKVLVEKPLGVDVQDLDKMESELSPDALESVRVVSPLRWYDGVQKVKQTLNRLGRVHTVNIWCQSYLPDWRERDYKTSYSADVAQGGVIRDLVHEIDYCNALFGLPVSSGVHCIGTNGEVIDIESSANVHLSWLGSKGEVVAVQLDYLTRKARRGISVYGENGECHTDLITGEYRELLSGEALVENLDNDRDKAMSTMLLSFLKQDGEGCDFKAAKKAMEIIQVCEERLHFN